MYANYKDSFYATGETVYKSWDPNFGSLSVIVLNCPHIASLSSSIANQKAAQNNYTTEPDLVVPEFVLLKLCCL